MSESEAPRGYVVKCQFCGRDWSPQFERTRADAHCPLCIEERMTATQSLVAADPLAQFELGSISPFSRAGDASDTGREVEFLRANLGTVEMMIARLTDVDIVARINLEEWRDELQSRIAAYYSNP